MIMVLKNFIYIPGDPNMIEQVLTNFKDIDVFDVYAPLTSIYRSNRYELVRENARVQSNLGMSGLNPLDRAAMRINGAVINARVGNLERRIGAMNLGEQIARSTSGFRL